jgi:cytochrome c oxidase subunit II
LSALAMIVLLSAVATGRQGDASPVRVVHMVAERFVFTPSEITVTEGTVVEFRIRSEDTSHGFHLAGPGDLNVEIPKRGRGDVRVKFDARPAGVYIFECSRLCGAGHDFMRGQVRVVPKPSASTPE